MRDTRRQRRGGGPGGLRSWGGAGAFGTGLHLGQRALRAAGTALGPGDVPTARGELRNARPGAGGGRAPPSAERPHSAAGTRSREKRCSSAASAATAWAQPEVQLLLSSPPTPTRRGSAARAPHGSRWVPHSGDGLSCAGWAAGADRQHLGRGRGVKTSRWRHRPFPWAPLGPWSFAFALRSSLVVSLVTSVELQCVALLAAHVRAGEPAGEGFSCWDTEGMQRLEEL